MQEGATYVANSPCDGALLTCGGSLIGLALDAEVHNVVSTDGAVVDDNVPSPEGNGVPLQAVSVMVSPHNSAKETYLFNLEALLLLAYILAALAAG